MPATRDGLFKPKFKRRRANGRAYTYTAKNWYYTFTHPLTRRRVKGSAGTADRKAALLAYAAAVNRAEKDAKEADKNAADPYRKHGKRSLLEHLDDWEAALLAAGDTRHHVQVHVARVRAVLDGCGFTHWSDMSASRVQMFIGELRERDRKRKGARGFGPRTRNFYMKAVKQFARWMQRDRRSPDNPLAYLSIEGVAGDERHKRRPFVVEELRLLIAAAESGNEVYGVAGPDRGRLYRFAAESGLRSSEIRSLTWRSFELDADPPTVTIEGTYAKSGRTDVLPLTDAMAQLLTAWRTQREDDADDVAVFRMPEQTNVVRMLREDLEAARAKWIKQARGSERKRRDKSSFLAYVDDAGRHADFHSLRHSFASALARGGVAPKTAMDLMRHRDIQLTMNIYTHTVLPDRATALSVLPDLDVKPAKRRAKGG